MRSGGIAVSGYRGGAGARRVPDFFVPCWRFSGVVVQEGDVCESSVPVAGRTVFFMGCGEG